MPRLEEVGYYLQGLWLLLRGRPEGFQFLDLSERGFWRSWWAIAYCLPPTLLSWAAFRMIYLGAAPEGTTTGPSFFLKLGIVEMTNWVLPLVAILIVARITGLTRYATAIVIANNWLSVPFQWCSVVVSMIQIMAPGDPSGALLYLILLTGYVFVVYQIVNRILGGARAAALAMVLTLFALPFIAQTQLLPLLGLIDL